MLFVNCKKFHFIINIVCYINHYYINQYLFMINYIIYTHPNINVYYDFVPIIKWTLRHH